MFPRQEHIYKLMKSDSYSRFIRSSAYQELLQAKKKVRKKKKTSSVWEELKNLFGAKQLPKVHDVRG